jgi:hypothetical protein
MNGHSAPAHVLVISFVFFCVVDSLFLTPLMLGLSLRTCKKYIYKVWALDIHFAFWYELWRYVLLGVVVFAGCWVHVPVQSLDLRLFAC